jgi:copper resistance protein C
MRRTGSMLAAAAALLLVLPTSASAHSELVGSRPADGSTVDKPPEHIVLSFSETPTNDSVVTVSGECSKNLADDSFVAGQKFHVQIVDGTGGKYEVNYSLVSAEDGHATEGSFSFTVKGPADCSKDESKGGDTAGQGDPDDDAASDDEAASDTEPASDEDDSSPLVPILLVGLGIIVIAALARFATRK